MKYRRLNEKQHCQYIKRAKIEMTVLLDVEPELRHAAGQVFAELGISEQEAIRMFYEQVCSRHALPFSLLDKELGNEDAEAHDIPNALTRATFAATDAGKNLVVCEDEASLFAQLGL